MTQQINDLIGALLAKPHHMNTYNCDLRRVYVRVNHRSVPNCPRRQWRLGVTVYPKFVHESGAIIVGKNPVKIVEEVRFYELKDLLISIEHASLLEAL